MVPFDLCRFRFRKQILPQCLAAIETRYFQYGYPGCQQHRYRLSIQCIQLLFPDFWLSRGITPHLYFEAASGIIAFILLGRLLEERAKQNTSTAIRRLAGLQPKTITIVTGSGEQTVPIENARIGDTIAVKPGERIAVDGTVISGDSYVDESMLSGEPIAVHKQAGEKVYAGTMNQKGAFHFTADKTGARYHAGSNHPHGARCPGK